MNVTLSPLQMTASCSARQYYAPFESPTPPRTPTELPALEARQLLAGNVSVFVNGSTLQINGDSAANQIQVSSNSDGNAVVTGNDTTINGAADSFVASEGFRWLALSMGNGDDEANIDGITVGREFRFLGGNGNDRLTVNNVVAQYFHVQGNGDDDVLDLNNLRAYPITPAFLSVV